MCGIAGWAGWEDAPPQAALERMCDVIVHRGPDDCGYHMGPRVALGMRRLSIIDLAGGHQPISSEDGRCTIVFNGEIYNHPELRRALEASGHTFATHSDTEAIVHLYEERGVDVVQGLNGMFAFAIWDDRTERLLVARDRLGIKPLYYWETAGGVAFASELKSIRVLDRFHPELDEEALALYLMLGYVPDPLTIYRGVRKLPPGHRLTWSRSEGVRIEPWWSPLRDEDPGLDEAEATAEIRRLIEDAVRIRMIADVPLGAFLSGGIDSSTVVAYMTRHSSQPVRTFSIGFEEPEFNEADDARAVSEALGTDHTQLIVRPDVDALIEQVVLAFDEPFADPSAIPTFLVSELARRHVKVALSGDGGDELFGGYERYDEVLRTRRGPPDALAPALGGLVRRLPQGTFGRNLMLDWTRDAEGRYAGRVGRSLDPREGGVGSAALTARASAFDRLLDPWFRQVPNGSLAHRMMSVDLLTYLPGDILTKVDRMSMAVSLEARVPLLDYRLAELAMRIPSDLKIRGGVGKWILREAVGPLLPPRVLEKRKQGFGVPLRDWFRKELKHRVDALATSEALAPWVDVAALQRVLREHHAGRRDQSATLWRLVVLDLWLTAEGAAPSGELAALVEGR